MTSKDTTLTEKIRQTIIDDIGLQVGGIKGVKKSAPCQKHVYLKNEVMDYDTEEITCTQLLSFEEQVNNLTQSILSLINNEVVKELEYVQELHDGHKFIGDFGDELVETAVLKNRINQLKEKK